ncbi:MAG: DUF2207 domain-containing protein [bacterium]
MKKLVITLLLSLLCFYVYSIKAKAQVVYDYQEKISDFSSEIQVETDSSLHVIENITVNAQHIEINHGIYRDFPTSYKYLGVLQHKVGFDLISVKRDNNPEPYKTKKLNNGVRVYIGDENSLVPSGIHTYTIEYRSTGQLGFFKDYDELYYNVTGNGWTFPIEKARLTLDLPVGIQAARDIQGVSLYTGPQGSKAQNAEVVFTFCKDGNCRLIIETTKSLAAKEGLTVAVGWPKGLVKQPSILSTFVSIIVSNLLLIILFMATGFIGFSYFIIWLLIGRDPRRNTIIPIFEPPSSLSPAEMRYLDKMELDNKMVIAALTHAAYFGIIAIEEKKGKFAIISKSYDYTKLSTDEKILLKAFFSKQKDLIKILGNSNLTPEERAVADKLLDAAANSSQKFSFNNSNAAKISKGIAKFRKAVTQQIDLRYLKQNKFYVSLGVGFSLSEFIIISFITSFQGAGNLAAIIFLTIWLSLWTAGVIALLTQIISSIKGLLSSGLSQNFFKTVGGIMPLILFALPFLAGEVVVGAILTNLIGISYVVLIIIQGIMHIFYVKALKARTIEGRKLQDQIEGFKMYLKATEAERIKIMHRVMPLTLDEYEKYLAYAIAMDLEGQWLKLFQKELEQAALTNANSGYSPTWYHSTTAFTSAGFVGGFASGLSSSIAAATTSSGSHSGSSGGGSSGGGGGGGGGGGW